LFAAFRRSIPGGGSKPKNETLKRKILLMKIMNFLQMPRWQVCVVLSALIALTCLLTSVAFADDATAKKAPATKTAAKPAKKKLTGAELYAINCNRCHPERYPTEWTSPQWKTLMTHMRVRANLPAKQAKEILKYLQEDSGN
jgi:mono/diheme cytochrome c family protein